MSDSDVKIWDAERLRIAADAAGVGLWSWNVDTNEISMDDHSLSLWGVPTAALLTFADLSARIIPPDVDRVRHAFEATRTVPGPYQIDFRIRHGEGLRWISARGRGADEGIVRRLMFGIFLDNSEHMQLKEEREMLAAEMSHRVKNLFAIASSLTLIAARSATTTMEMAHDLTQRLATLGRAHDLIRPLPGEVGLKAAGLSGLLTILLAPYDKAGTVIRRIRVSAPELPIGERAITTLALIVHELATNSVKYGSLSVPSGTLELSCTEQNDKIVIVWTEEGGPPVSVPIGGGGFGSTLLARSIGQQFGGSIAYEWPPKGVTITIELLKERVVA